MDNKELKVQWWDASRRGVERGQVESRRATLPQRGAAVHVSPGLTMQRLSTCFPVAFTRPHSPVSPGATRVYRGTRVLRPGPRVVQKQGSLW